LFDWQLKAAESSICQHLEINLPAGTTGSRIMRESLLERKLAQQGAYWSQFQFTSTQAVEGLGARLGLVVRLAGLAESFGGASLR
jgi:hypothetical protein